jgi:hypothetical protein
MYRSGSTKPSRMSASVKNSSRKKNAGDKSAVPPQSLPHLPVDNPFFI